MTGGNVDRPAGPGRTTPLMAAAGCGHLLCTQQLLDWGAEASCSPDGTTALMVAASGGHTQCVTALIKAGAHVNSHDHSGMSAIMLAAAVGHVMVLRCLIRHKAALERLSLKHLVHAGRRSESHRKYPKIIVRYTRTVHTGFTLGEYT